MVFSMTQLARWMWLLALLLFVLVPLHASAQEDANNSTSSEGRTAEEEAEPGDAVLFPWFTLGMGTFAFLFITRLAKWIPYTALMFVIGVSMGAATNRLESMNLLKTSIDDFWVNINSEVLLLVFLPGLIFKDASSLDPHLFQAAFWQCVMFAFPMVLGGTILTALVAYYIFPYGWSFNLALTFGSILSATDPVAVAALLDSVGAPPRLKIHISGESLLNDGSAIVFFTIFSQLFLLELNIEGFGRDIDVAGGFALFFRMSLGGVAIGLFFGIGTLMVLWLLDRRLSREENVVQTATTFTMAYLCYFTADVVWGTSGVIANLTLGLCVNTFGKAFINDNQLSEDFWSIIEHLLNTVLFTLGGLVWGQIISNNDDENPLRLFTARDWGYLFALFAFLLLIRYALFFGCFPITNYLGLSTNWRETFFSCYAGLRGAVGISLALSIDNTVKQAAGALSMSAIQTNKLFGMVGGIAFLTLVINATTSGPLLIKLGLADATEFRKTLLKVVCARVRSKTIDDVVCLLAQPWFKSTNFAIVRHHVSSINDLTASELAAAAERYHQANQYKSGYTPPELRNFLPYLEEESKDSSEAEKGETHVGAYFRRLEALPHDGDDAKRLRPKIHGSMFDDGTQKPLPVEEVRRLFLEVLRTMYMSQIKSGYMVNREYLVYALLESIDFASDKIKESLCDWKYSNLLEKPLSEAIHRIQHHKQVISCCECFCGERTHYDLEHLDLRLQVERCVSFLEAHKQARRVLQEEFSATHGQLSEAEQIVLGESDEECRLATELLESFPKESLQLIISHKFNSILLNRSVTYIEALTESHVIKDTEAETFLEDIQEELFANESCSAAEHPGELPNFKSELSSETDKE